MKRIYLCGPMSGLPESNYPAFNREAARLRSLGYHVENPAENPEPPGREWSEYMRMAIAQLMTCDTVAMLEGWQNSRGANLEQRIAFALDMQIRKASALDKPCQEAVC